MPSEIPLSIPVQETSPNAPAELVITSNRVSEKNAQLFFFSPWLIRNWTYNIIILFKESDILTNKINLLIYKYIFWSKKSLMLIHGMLMFSPLAFDPKICRLKKSLSVALTISSCTHYQIQIKNWSRAVLQCQTLFLQYKQVWYFSAFRPDQLETKKNASELCQDHQFWSSSFIKRSKNLFTWLLRTEFY